MYHHYQCDEVYVVYHTHADVSFAVRVMKIPFVVGTTKRLLLSCSAYLVTRVPSKVFC